MSTWINKLKRIVISQLNQYNVSGITYNQSGVVYGGNVTEDSWTNQNKN